MDSFIQVLDNAENIKKIATDEVSTVHTYKHINDDLGRKTELLSIDPSSTTTSLLQVLKGVLRNSNATSGIFGTRIIKTGETFNATEFNLVIPRETGTRLTAITRAAQGVEVGDQSAMAELNISALDLVPGIDFLKPKNNGVFKSLTVSVGSVLISYNI